MDTPAEERANQDIGRILPARRFDLVIRPVGDDGRHVVKDPTTGEYFQIGPQEAFLLDQLDGAHSGAQICEAFEKRFGQRLTLPELLQFVNLALARRLLQEDGHRSNGAAVNAGIAPQNGTTLQSPPTARPQPSGSPGSGFAHQSLLYWRKKLFDPDRFFTWAEPRLRFLWTPTFVFLWGVSVLSGAVAAWTYGGAWLNQFPQSLRWETMVVAWLVILLSALCHESAHGLTCKHFGGEVHEIGFLLVLLMPGLYCNVSDAWLFREKSQRLWVTFAGAVCDLLIWSAAIGLWRLTLSDTYVNYLAWVIVSVTGIRSLFNLLPLLKLDGYYLLSDALEIPNLRERAFGRWAAFVRWLLWGAPWPRREPRSKLLLLFGIASWSCSLIILGVMVVGLARFLHSYIGSSGYVGGSLLGVWLAMGFVNGFSAGEAAEMIRSRRGRTLGWLAMLAAFGAAMELITVEDRYGGPFKLYPAARAEIRAPVAGFIAEVRVGQGDLVSPGKSFVRLEVPDLDSRLAQRRAEAREADAALKLLESGTRPEEIAELESRVARSKAWKELAESHVKREQAAIVQDMKRRELVIQQRVTELGRAKNRLERDENLVSRSAVSQQELEEGRASRQVAEALWKQAQTERETLAARGAIESEQMLILREQDLANAEVTLALKKLGPRPEELDVARAKRTRAQADVSYLESLERKQEVQSPTGGVVITHRVHELVGRYVPEGELICEVEDRSAFDVEIRLPEQDAARIAIGRKIGIKFRALPYDSFEATVERIAPAAILAEPGESQNRVLVYCRIERTDGLLRSQMTGYARIYCDKRPIGEILVDRGVRLLRTEFWW